MTEAIKIVSNRTIVRKITIGTPIPTVKSFTIDTSIGSLTDVGAGLEDGLKDGSILVYDASLGKFIVKNILIKHRLDGGGDTPAEDDGIQPGDLDSDGQSGFRIDGETF